MWKKIEVGLRFASKQVDVKNYQQQKQTKILLWKNYETLEKLLKCDVLNFFKDL
jgi:hypothetical protein